MLSFHAPQTMPAYEAEETPRVSHEWNNAARGGMSRGYLNDVTIVMPLSSSLLGKLKRHFQEDWPLSWMALLLRENVPAGRHPDIHPHVLL